MCEIGTKKDRTSSRKAVLFSAGCLRGNEENIWCGREKDRWL